MEGEGAKSDEEVNVPRFKLKTIEKLMKLQWNDSTKMSGDALKLSAEFMRLFVLEAFQRAQDEAEEDGEYTVEPHHIEQILPQLLLDF